MFKSKNLSVPLSILMLSVASPSVVSATDYVSQIVTESQHNDSSYQDFGKFILDEQFLNGNYTIIELSQEELQLMQPADGIGTVVGGTLVIPGHHTLFQQEVIRRDFVGSHINNFENNVSNKNDSERFLGTTEVRNVRPGRPNVFFTNSPLGYAIGDPGVSLSVSVSASVSNQFNSNVSVSGPLVSAAVGFNFTSTTNVTSSGSWDVPNNSRDGMLRGFALHAETHFEVWNNPLIGNATRTGDGTAFRATGGAYFQRTVF